MGSAESLVAQGDEMAPDELARFRAEPHGPAACVLRRADEAAKRPGRAVPSLAEPVPRSTSSPAAKRRVEASVPAVSRAPRRST